MVAQWVAKLATDDLKIAVKQLDDAKLDAEHEKHIYAEFRSANAQYAEHDSRPTRLVAGAQFIAFRSLSNCVVGGAAQRLGFAG